MIASGMFALAMMAQVQGSDRTFPTRSAQPARCQPTADQAASRSQQIAPRKLGDLPPATQIYAVFNRVDGCSVPVVVRKGIGANPQRQVPMARTVPRIDRD